MRKLIALSLISGLAALAPCHAADRSPVDQRHPLAANGSLSVRNTAGSIKVEAWSQADVQITGSLSDGVQKLAVTGSGSQLNVEVVLSKGMHIHGDADLVLHVPASVAVKLDGTSADLAVTGSQGPLQLRSVSGNIEVNAASRQLEAHSVSGNVTIHAQQAQNSAVSSVSGNIDLFDLGGQLRAESVSGDVDVKGGPFSQLALKSVSGNVQITASASGANAVMVAESLSGNVELNAPASLNAKVALKSFSGSKRIQLPGAVLDAEGRKSHYTLGSGGARVELTSHSGDVLLRSGR